MKTRIGILGGAFNPPTLGHVNLARLVLSKRLVDNIWFVPSVRHKFGKIMEPFEIRRIMCLLAIKDYNSTISVSGIEGELGDYDGSTICLFDALKEKYGRSSEFSFVIGSDNANNLHKFREYREFMDQHRIITVLRDKAELVCSYDGVNRLLTDSKHQIINSDGLVGDMSSTKARNQIKQYGWSPLVNKPVQEIITMNNLYRD
jgi:nicotinate-nucleotide adenylyltransferase